MKKYDKPSLKMEELETMDIITVSGGVTPQFVKEGTSTNADSGTANWDSDWDIN